MNVEQQVVLEVAAAVGDEYLAAANSPDDAIVSAAYDRLQAETDRLFQAVARRQGADGVRMVFTRCPEPYVSDQELITAVRATGVLEVATAAIHSERIHPRLGCELGGPFDRFRAMHDLIGHAGAGLGFGLADELAAWSIQDRLYGSFAAWAFATEILGVNSARFLRGEAPELKAMLLDPALLARSRARLTAGNGQQLGR